MLIKINEVFEVSDYKLAVYMVVNYDGEIAIHFVVAYLLQVTSNSYYAHEHIISVAWQSANDSKTKHALVFILS